MICNAAACTAAVASTARTGIREAACIASIRCRAVAVHILANRGDDLTTADRIGDHLRQRCLIERIDELEVIRIFTIADSLIIKLRAVPDGEGIDIELLELFITAAQAHRVMQRRDRIAGLELDELTAAHAIGFQTAAGTEDDILLIMEIIDNLQIAFHAIEFHWHCIHIVAVALVRDLDIDRMPIEHRPLALEIILEDTLVPIRIDIGIAAEIKDQVVLLAEIEELAMHRRKDVHRRRGKPAERRAILIDIDRCILERIHREYRLAAARHRIRDAAARALPSLAGRSGNIAAARRCAALAARIKAAASA